MQVPALIKKHQQSPRIVVLKAVSRFPVLLLRTFSGFSTSVVGFAFAFCSFAQYYVVHLIALLSNRDKKKKNVSETFPGKS